MSASTRAVNKRGEEDESAEKDLGGDHDGEGDAYDGHAVGNNGKNAAGVHDDGGCAVMPTLMMMLSATARLMMLATTVATAAAMVNMKN